MAVYGLAAGVPAYFHMVLPYYTQLFVAGGWSIIGGVLYLLGWSAVGQYLAATTRAFS